jgi:thymidylate synthase (FAD)
METAMYQAKADRNRTYVGENHGAVYGEWRHAPRPGSDYDVLDNGYAKLIRTWGSDEEIIETARMSTDKGFLGWDPGPCPTCSGKGSVFVDEGWPEATCTDCSGKGRIPGDAKLLRYLYEHKHSTPFEFAGLTIEIQAPLMVYREWHRHRTQAYSEMSARYVQMPNLHYVPSVQRIIDSSRKSGNRQASGAGVLSIPGFHPAENEAVVAERIRQLIGAEQQRVYAQYEELLRYGVSKEIARLDTPVARYSRMRATGNLRNWLAFLTLRMDPAAQFEIRQYAWCVADAISKAFPRTWELALEGMAPKKEFTPEVIRLLQEARDALSGTFDFIDVTEAASIEKLSTARRNIDRVLQALP